MSEHEARTIYYRGKDVETLDREELLKACRDIERRLSDEHGGFSFFALLQRFGVTGSYDLVVAAPWLEPDSRDDTALLSKALQDSLTVEELRQISGVVIVRPDHPTVKHFSVMVSGLEHGSVEQSYNSVGRLELSSGLLITVKPR